MLRPVLTVLAFCSVSFAADAPKPQGRPSHLQVKSATLITGSGAPVQLTNVKATIPPKEQQPKPTFISSGSAFLTPESLTTLIQDKLGKNEKLSDFKVKTENGNKAMISAKVKKAGVPVPFSVEGPVTVTAEGQLRMAIKSQKAMGVPMKALAEAFGMEPKDSIKTKQGKGFRIEEDAIFIDPNQLLGSIAQGHVQKATVSDKGLTLIFGEAGTQARSVARTQAPSKAKK